MIKVYFETDSYSELVATFEDEELYIACLEILEKKAIERNFNMVTESVND